MIVMETAGSPVDLGISQASVDPKEWSGQQEEAAGTVLNDVPCTETLRAFHASASGHGASEGVLLHREAAAAVQGSTTSVKDERDNECMLPRVTIKMTERIKRLRIALR